MDKKKVYQPINIAEIHLDNTVSNLYLGMAPGKKDKNWDRDLYTDLDQIQNTKIGAIVCLLTWREMQLLSLQDYPREAQKRGIIFLHFPIKDCGVPKCSDMAALIESVLDMLQNGINVLIHCRCGNGRASAVCACCLTHFNYDYSRAIEIVKERKPTAVLNIDQLSYVRKYCRLFSS